MLKIRLQGTVRDIRWLNDFWRNTRKSGYSRCRRYFQIKGQIDIFAHMQRLTEQKKMKGR